MSKRNSDDYSMYFETDVVTASGHPVRCINSYKSYCALFGYAITDLATTKYKSPLPPANRSPRATSSTKHAEIEIIDLVSDDEDDLDFDHLVPENDVDTAIEELFSDWASFDDDWFETSMLVDI